MMTATCPTQFTDYDMNKVHVELEKLNIATDVINKLELQLDEARAAFREIQTSWTQKLDTLLKKLGTCIEKSRPYYEARLKASECQLEAQKAAQKFERANSMHAIAKQQVSLTHESLTRQGAHNVDPACLEVLNHHIQRVNEAEKERLKSVDEHRDISLQYEAALSAVAAFEKDLRRTISKSKPYFEARVEFTRVLENQKLLIERLQAEIRQKKLDYAASLKRLEAISEEIHESRQRLGQRAPGVGAEHPGPPVLTESLSPPDLKPRASSAPVELIVSETSPSVAAGVILLAQQLSQLDSLLGGRDRRLRAFLFPPTESDEDCIYKTIPAGVKIVPTPPTTPLTDTAPITVAAVEESDESDAESLSGSATMMPIVSDERIERLIAEINKPFDLSEQSSASGQEDT